MPRYGDEDFEQAVMLATVRTSRAARQCATCGGQISPGEQYRRIAFPPSLDVPRWSAYAVHLSAHDCWIVLAYRDTFRDIYTNPDPELLRLEIWGQAVLNPEFLPGGGIGGSL